MPLPVVRSPLGLPLGDRGLLPLPDALPGVGAGVVAGGPYTVPKGCWIPIPGCPTGRGQGLCLRAYNRLTHIQRLLVWQPAPLQSCTTQACFSSLLIPSHMLQGGGSLLGPPAHAYATGHPLLPGTAPLLGRGPLTCTLQGPFHLHTWTLAMKTPHWSLLVGAPGSSCSRGRPPMRGPGGAPHGRCRPVRGARAGGGGGGGGAVGRGGGTEWLREVVHGGHRELHGGVRDGVGAEGPVGGAKARGGRMSGLLRGLARGRARRGREEGEAWSAVLYGGSLTVPRAKAAGTRGRGVPGDGAWHWDVRAPDTVSTPPIGSARALSSGASQAAPSP